MEIKNTLVSKLLDNEVSAKRSALSKFGEKLWKFAKNKLSTRYGYKIEISDDYLIGVVNGFINQYDKNHEKRNLNEAGFLCDTTALIPVDENTFIYVIAGNPLDIDTNTKLLLEATNSNNGRSINTKLKIYLYGKYAKKYLNILKSKIQKKNTGNLRIFNISADTSDKKNAESFQSIISDLIPRDIDSLFYDGNIKEEVINHIDGFFNTKELYKEKNLNYKTSLLLYGEPGTGKSSLANALCAKYNLDMVLINLNTFDKLNVEMLTKCINGDDKTYLVLIEDIDTIFNLNREDQTIEKDDKKIVNKILQFLDSNSSPNNVIFVCTTNHIDKLDAAILRKGRIDKSIYIGPINKDTAYEMCKSFDLSEESVASILDKYKEDEKINQSSLQGEILDAVKAEIMAKSNNSDTIELTKDEFGSELDEEPEVKPEKIKIIEHDVIDDEDDEEEDYDE